METCIELKGVSVRYRLSKERVNTLKEFTIQCFRRKVEYEEFWALKTLSLDVRKGDQVGIVGLNGAGKSTLLRVVAGVIVPVQGTVEVVGTVTPLTQLGAGFNGELTGRENVYLNGAVFGLSRRQMDRKLDDIVAFAELANFVNSPLRTYSTGMIARLAFATAVHMEPEILLLDEVLAVGDASFQHKCMEQIKQFKRQGVTILFVSHDLSQVRKACNQVLWLDHGRAMAWGDSESVITQYQDYLSSGGIA